MIGLGSKEESSNAVGGPVKRSLLDGIITGLFGADTGEMTPERRNEVERARGQDRRDASSMAVSASQSPGSDFMWAPKVGGSDGSPLSLLGDIVKMFSGGGTGTA